MKNKTVVAALMGLCIFAGMMLSNRVDGTCDTGIKKEHLDSTPGHFVDNTTIEIDSTNGLRVKPSYINTKVGSGNISPSTYAGEQSVTLPNGLIMKFGTVSSVTANGDATVTFSPAFSHIISAFVSYSTGENQAESCSVKTKAVGSLVLHNGYNTAATLDWFAIGY
jgi:hypothetical protein